MNGILLVDKPEGWTSNDVVCKLKGVFHERRIGHSGTLDPMATGLLPVFIGRATRAVQFAENDKKEYIAGLRLGLTTDTLDTTGTVLSTGRASVSDAEVRDCLNGFLGKQKQIPPMYSAIKIKGQRLYDIARSGGKVDRPPRDIEISSIELLGLNSENDYLIKILCSKGTYIRSLCDDIGKRLGCGGCMSYLRRTRCGVFSIAEATALTDIIEADEETRAGLLLPIDMLFSDYPRFMANEEQNAKIRNGSDFFADLNDGVYRVYSQNSEFLMLGRANEGRVKLIKSFFSI